MARQLKPVCQVAYHRTARVATSQAGPIRLTVDQNLHTRTIDGAAFDHAGPGAKLLDDRLIVEMKFREGLPELFRRAIEEFESCGQGRFPNTNSRPDIWVLRMMRPLPRREPLK